VNYHHQADRRLITGTGGSGKTTEFLRLLVAHRAPWKFVFDPEREISHKLGWPICRDLPGCAYRAAQREPVCFDPTDICEELEEGFDLFCRFVWNFSIREHGVKLLCADEFQDFTSTGAGGLPRPFRTIVQKGRRQEIDLLLIAQELGDAHNKLRKQLSHIITFRHEDDGALDWLRRNGFDPEAVKALKYPGGWICRHRYTGNVTTNAKSKKLLAA
jgi:hypothetical protein